MTSSTGELWDRIGLLEEESQQVLIALFEKYETMLGHADSREESQHFFSLLQIVLDQVESCNVNRR